MIILNKIENDSIASELDLKKGDILKTINDHSIHDIIDYRFYISDEFVSVEIQRDHQRLIFDIEKDADEDLGVTFEPVKYRCCGNKCIFCFIDQNPTGMRTNIYFKDEDYRLSFLHGNYVTLTNISQNDLDRIVEQRLTPLYISVHSTDVAVRKLMLGIKKDDRLLEKIKFLTDQRIELHVQIVLCPGINDGEHLDKTIRELAQFFPGIQSIAIVPVGLTKHREHLFPLQQLSPEKAKEIIDFVDIQADFYKRNLGTYFVFLADEFYLNANKQVPAAEKYEEYSQYENGVGMLRYFMDEFAEQSSHFPESISQKHNIRIVTAELASHFIGNTIIPRLNQIKNLKASLAVVVNNFYGQSVKVSGLMTGSDIYEQLSKLPPVDTIFLPENCLNTDGLFLDDWTVPYLEQKVKQQIKIVGLDLVEHIQMW